MANRILCLVAWTEHAASVYFPTVKTNSAAIFKIAALQISILLTDEA